MTKLVKCINLYRPKNKNSQFCKKTCSPAYRKWKKLRRKAEKFKQPISKFFRKEIEEIYSNRPEGMEVDHIIPRNGKIVSGLHVPWNLQYLSKSENNQKSNKIINFP